jgi:hypothetical protein
MSNYGQVYTAKSSGRGLKQRKQYIEDRPMKRTLKQKFREWLFDSEQDKRAVNEIAIDEDTIDSERCIKFKVFNASGGRIIETSFYDSQKDRNRRSLYVITNDQEIGHEIDKIITMEHLKQ